MTFDLIARIVSAQPVGSGAYGPLTRLRVIEAPPPGLNFPQTHFLQIRSTVGPELVGTTHHFSGTVDRRKVTPKDAAARAAQGDKPQFWTNYTVQSTRPATQAETEAIPTPDITHPLSTLTAPTPPAPRTPPAPPRRRLKTD